MEAVGDWQGYLNQFTIRPMTMVAIGKTGKGKSSTLNTLVRLEQNGQMGGEYFKTGEGADGVSSKVNDRIIVPNGFPPCRLVDTIGLFDPKFTKTEKEMCRLRLESAMDEEHSLVLAQFLQVVDICKDGIDAFLFVVKAQDRATKEEDETIDVIFRYLGWNILEYIIFVVTGKDEASNEAFQGWKNHICDLLQKRGYAPERIQERFIFVDNKHPTQAQAYQLLSLIRYVSDMNRGTPYLPAAFDDAQRKLEKEKQRIQQKLNEEFQAKIDERTKPIRERHEQETRILEEKIARTELEASKLRDDQVLEKRRVQEEIGKLMEEHKEEQECMKREMEQQIRRIEMEKIDRYEGEMKGMRMQLEEMANIHRESMAQFQQALAELRARRDDDDEPWYGFLKPLVTGVVTKFLGKIF